MKRILVFASSPRKCGNSDCLANAFCEGAIAAGNIVKTVYIRDLNINGCRGCEYCYDHNGECVQLDDMQIIYHELENIDIVVFATPIYYQAFPAQLKAVVDRLYVTENREFPVNGAVLLATYATPGPKMAELTVLYYKTLIEYHKWKNLGIIVRDEMDDPTDILNDEILEESRKLGLSL